MDLLPHWDSHLPAAGQRTEAPQSEASPGLPATPQPYPAHSVPTRKDVDLLQYWNLRERPFETTWDTRFFYQSRDHIEALDRLTFLVEEKTMLFGMLTGEIGCGKTLTRAVFSERLEARQFYVVTQENSAFTFSDLLASILQYLEGSLENAGTLKYERYERLRLLLEYMHTQNKHLVLIFDEAQEMSRTTLNELKLLTNLNGGGRNFLTIVLVGQPELRTRVAELPAIDQRISLRFHLESLGFEDAANYLRHRLQVAGHTSGDLFAADAVERAYQASVGVPRELNRIAKLSLEYSWLKGYPQVTRAAVDAVVHDLQRQQNLPRS